MLEGVRIIDFTQTLPGPFASMRLADRGAEVIKIEPLKGEPARYMGEMKDGVGLLYLANNRNKKSIALNLKTEEGKQIALNLARHCDVLIESFRPGVMERLGLSYQEVSRVNPIVIYASLSGYGQNGLMSRQASHDLNFMALSGALAQLRDQKGSLIHPTILLADMVGGISASETILAALVQRGIKKRGGYLDISILEEMVRLMGTHAAIYNETGNKHGPVLLAGGMISYGLYGTKDERTVALAALEPKFWTHFCHAVDRSQWIPAQMTPQTDSNPVYLELCQLFQSRTWEEWLEFGLKADCCLTPVIEAGEWEWHPHFLERKQKIRDEDSPSPVKVGQHTREILQEWLRADEEQIDKWIENRIIL
ncbi:CaiB/BaiF CoA transferase family protein [Paenactinomyces guangxiensis]|uniref:CoA transferase n=1 Tax=Paenactinomyces guangxiensis TaxID=1490290 RepID=A0A7W1WR65_9BACL|nr:CaiB/BaiF CoA-transferase family protein [Paenactinomyces guangxiensis]MBA4494574.1 CoA transferase [Paenactinomyces guangxiensis]MBH8591663.1 CoA transferase [Paenactinomyces guangxiensis]